MSNLPQGGPWTSFRNISNAGVRVSDYAAVNVTRQGRFDARSARRYGDWGILGIPTAMLWFDEVLVAAAIDEESNFPVPAIIDIWG